PAAFSVSGANFADRMTEDMPHSLGWSSSRNARRSSQPAKFRIVEKWRILFKQRTQEWPIRAIPTGGSPIVSIGSRMIDVMELLAHSGRAAIRFAGVPGPGRG